MIENYDKANAKLRAEYFKQLEAIRERYEKAIARESAELAAQFSVKQMQLDKRFNVARYEQESSSTQEDRQ